MAAILVVDDEPQIRDYLETVLAADNHEVHQAANGREAIQCAERFHFDLAVCDLYMPESDGMETIMALRGSYPRMKIIAVSGGGVTGDLLPFALSLGAQKAVYKPFTRDEIIGAVHELLRDQPP